MILEHSDQFAEVAAALAKAQLVIENPTKNKTANVKTRTGTDYSYDYTDLAAVLDAVRKPFADNGIALLQPPSVGERGLVSVQTLLVHTTGQWVGCTLSASVADPGPQAIGTAISYLRRYGLQSLAGLAAEDDDAKPPKAKPQGTRGPQQSSEPSRSAQSSTSQRGPSAAPPLREPQARASGPVAVQPALANELPASPEFVTDIQRRKLWKIATDIGWREIELQAFLKRRFNVDSTKQIPTARYDEIVKAVQAGDVPQTESAETAS